MEKKKRKFPEDCVVIIHLEESNLKLHLYGLLGGQEEQTDLMARVAVVVFAKMAELVGKEKMEQIAEQMSDENSWEYPARNNQSYETNKSNEL